VNKARRELNLKPLTPVSVLPGSGADDYEPGPADPDVDMLYEAAWGDAGPSAAGAVLSPGPIDFNHLFAVADPSAAATDGDLLAPHVLSGSFRFSAASGVTAHADTTAQTAVGSNSPGAAYESSEGFDGESVNGSTSSPSVASVEGGHRTSNKSIKNSKETDFPNRRTAHSRSVSDAQPVTSRQQRGGACLNTESDQ